VVLQVWTLKKQPKTPAANMQNDTAWVTIYPFEVSKENCSLKIQKVRCYKYIPSPSAGGAVGFQIITEEEGCYSFVRLFYTGR
jgi:hypothetical protein